MSGLVYLITGANRGIGLGLTQHYLSLDDTTVIAAVRDLSSADDLEALKPASNSKLLILKIDSASTTDAEEAVKLLTTKYGISHIDIVIANAGRGSFWGSALDTPISEFHEHFTVNATGTLVLFQAMHKLLSISKDPKFVPVGTPVGSIGEIENFPLPGLAYGSSKAALHYLTRKLHFEHENMTIFPISPGWVQTGMGTGAATAVGMSEAPTTVDESVAGLTKVIDSATRATAGGKFLSYDGKNYGW